MGNHLDDLVDWLSERHPLWAWEKGYETYNHLLWLLLTFVGTILIGLLCEDKVLWLSILFGGGQVAALIQEGIRTFVCRKKGTGRQTYHIKNFFGSMTGITFGGMLAYIIWRVFFV